jgi:hypothetical protein
VTVVGMGGKGFEVMSLLTLLVFSAEYRQNGLGIQVAQDLGDHGPFLFPLSILYRYSIGTVLYLLCQ